MATVIDEHTQWVGVGGKPLTDGSLYIGIAGSDPVANPKAIFSDSALSIPAANPQPLDSQGRTTLKLYLDGEYSLQANDVHGTQQYQSLEAGTSSEGLSIIGLTDVSGGDTIVASGDIFAYVDKAIYTFTVAQVNTGPVTLNIDSVGAKSILKNNTIELDAGDFEADQVVIVSYNGTADNFQWVDQKVELFTDKDPKLAAPLDTNSFQVRWSKGADIASAAALVLGTDGNSFDVTGTTAITSIGSVGIGTVIKLHFDDVLTLTHNGADLVLPGAANIITAAGDEAEFVEYASGDWRCTNYQIAAQAPTVALTESFTSAEQVITTAGLLTIAHGLSSKPNLLQVILICKTGEFNFSVDDELIINPGQNFESSFNYGLSIVPDSTNLNVRIGASGFVVLDKTTGIGQVITVGSWRLIFKAWA